MYICALSYWSCYLERDSFIVWPIPWGSKSLATSQHSLHVETNDRASSTPNYLMSYCPHALDIPRGCFWLLGTARNSPSCHRDNWHTQTNPPALWHLSFLWRSREARASFFFCPCLKDPVFTGFCLGTGLPSLKNWSVSCTLVGHVGMIIKSVF